MKRRTISTVLTAGILLTLVGCGSKTSETTETSGSKDTTAKAQIAEIVIAGGSIDDGSFCQGTWEGIQQYASEKDLNAQHYVAAEETTDSQLESIKLAVENGAEIVFANGFNFETTIYEAQDIYPDVKFVLLDGEPHNDDNSEYKTSDNTSCALYEEHQAGFLAGYALVKEGFRKLGFMGGMAYPAVMKYGYGFIAGADYAAKEEGLSQGDVTVNYTYTGNFEATPDNQTLAASWYQDGIECIFACGGSVGYSVMAAAEQTKTFVVGVDIDQSADSETVITSAVKNLKNSVYAILNDWGNSAFPGGKTQHLGVKEDGVSLPMNTSRFKNFSQEDYDNIYQALLDDTDEICSSLPDDTTADSADKLKTEIVTVKVDNN